MALKPEPVDSADRAFTQRRIKESSRRLLGHDDEANSMMSPQQGLVSQPVNFLIEQTRSEVVLDPVQKDVVFVSRHANPGRGHRHGYRTREVTEYANYTISHHEAEVNSKQLPKKYRCRFCIYKTSYKSDLNRHLRKHGIAPQHCPLCNMPFKTTGNLDNHIRQAHGDVAENMGIMPSSLSSMCLEGVVAPPLSVGAFAGLANFPQSQHDSQLDVSAQSRYLQHKRPHKNFPALSQAVTSPVQLSCHMCPFVSSDSQVLARHILTHPGEEEASRTSQSSQNEASTTRHACEYCSVVLTSVDELETHKRSCGKCRDSSGGEKDRESVSRTPDHGYKDGPESSEKSGVPRLETIQKLRKSIIQHNEINDRKKSEPVAGQVHYAMKDKRSMSLPHIPAAQAAIKKVSRKQVYSSPDPLQSSTADVADNQRDFSKATEEYVSSKPKKICLSKTAGETVWETLPVDLSQVSKAQSEHAEKTVEPDELNEASEFTYNVSNKSAKAQQTHKTLVQGQRDGGVFRHSLSERKLPRIPVSAVERNTVSQEERLPDRRDQSDCPSNERHDASKSTDSVLVESLPVNNSDKPIGVPRFPIISTTHRGDPIQSSQPFSVSDEQFTHKVISVKEEPKSPDASMDLEETQSNMINEASFRSCSGVTLPETNSSSSSRDESQYNCDLCQRTFRGITRLFVHFQLSHNNFTKLNTSSIRKVANRDIADNSDQSPPDIYGSNCLTGSDRSKHNTLNQHCQVCSSLSLSTFSEEPYEHLSMTVPTDTSVMPGQGGSCSHNRVSSDREASTKTAHREFHGTQVVSQPPSSGRYAKLVSDFDEFASKPYACSLCFFRTPRLSELSLHVHNHLTGCSNTHIPATARFQPTILCQVERGTSPWKAESTHPCSPSSDPVSNSPSYVASASEWRPPTDQKYVHGRLSSSEEECDEKNTTDDRREQSISLICNDGRHMDTTMNSERTLYTTAHSTSTPQETSMPQVTTTRCSNDTIVNPSESKEGSDDDKHYDANRDIPVSDGFPPGRQSRTSPSRNLMEKTRSSFALPRENRHERSYLKRGSHEQRSPQSQNTVENASHVSHSKDHSNEAVPCTEDVSLKQISSPQKCPVRNRKTCEGHISGRHRPNQLKHERKVRMFKKKNGWLTGSKPAFGISAISKSNHCRKCEKSFSLKQLLVRHMQVIHPAFDSSPSQKTPSDVFPHQPALLSP